MELNIVVIVLSAILSWFILQGTIDTKRVFSHNQDDVHWIAAAAVTVLILFVIGMITSACVVNNI